MPEGTTGSDQPTGRLVDVPELLAARNGQEVMHHEESYQQMIGAPNPSPRD